MMKGLCPFRDFLVLTFVLVTEGATLHYQMDQNSTDISMFRLFEGNLGGTEFTAVTLDATGTGGKAFVKIFTFYDKTFDISVYIPGIVEVDRIGIQTVKYESNDDPIFMDVIKDFVLDGYVVKYNNFNQLELRPDEALLVTSTGDLTNLYVYQPITPDELISLHCIHGNDGVTAGGVNTNKGLAVDSIVSAALWGREFIIPQVPSRMRGYTIKVISWEPNVNMTLRRSGSHQTEVFRFIGYEPMEFYFTSNETASIRSTSPLYVMQYTWGGFGDAVGPAALTVLDHRLSYVTRTFENRPSVYDVYVSMSCKRQHLTAVYDYEFDYYKESEIGTSVKLGDEEWVTVVRGPYTSLSPVIFMTIEEEVWLNGRNVTDTALFNVAVYSICKVSMCTGASMVEVSETAFSRDNVGVKGLPSRFKGLNDTFVNTIPPKTPTDINTMSTTAYEDSTTDKHSTPTGHSTDGSTLSKSDSPTLSEMPSTTAAQTPQNTTAVQTPQTTTAAQTPQNTTAVQTPQNTTAVQTPQTTTAAQTPQNTTAVQTPQTTTAVQTPQNTTAVQTPQNTTAVQTPQNTTAAQTTQNTTAAQTTQSSTAAQTPQSTTAAQTTQSTKTPQTSQGTSADQTQQNTTAAQSTPSTTVAQTSQSTSAATVSEDKFNSDSTEMISTTTAYRGTTLGDSVIISDEGCPCVHVSGAPAGYKANELTGYYLRKLVTNNLSSATSFHLHSNRQVYRHERCSSVLFFHDWPASYWLIGPFIGASKGYMLNHGYPTNVKDLSEPWRLYDLQQNVWKDDTAIVANCSCQDYPCAALRLTDDPLYKISGTFYIYGNLNERPVYKHGKEDMYISYYKGPDCASPNDSHYWVVGEQVGTRGGLAFAPDKANLPEDIAVPWSVNVNNVWSEDTSIAVRCVS